MKRLVSNMSQHSVQNTWLPRPSITCTLLICKCMTCYAKQSACSCVVISCEVICQSLILVLKILLAQNVKTFYLMNVHCISIVCPLSMFARVASDHCEENVTWSLRIHKTKFYPKFVTSIKLHNYTMIKLVKQ